MTCSLYRVAADGIDRLVSNPARAREILSADDDNWIISRPKGIVGFLLKLTPISVETVTPREPATTGDLASVEENECDLDKAWHGLHYLFTGTAWEGDEPACYLVRGGEDVGDSDFDNQPRLLRPERVRKFSAFLDSLSDDELRRRYDPKAMTALEVYPEIWDRPARPGEPALAFLLDAFHELRTFVARAARTGDGLLVHLG